MPGQSSTIAVSRRNVGFSPKHEGVAIYDDGVMRPTTTQTIQEAIELNLILKIL